MPALRSCFRLQLLLLAAIACVAPPAFAQLDEDEFPPGLLATYTAGGKTVTRVEPDSSFDWGESAPDQRLPAGKFEAKFIGNLLNKKSAGYTLHAYVAGNLTVEVDGKQILVGKSGSAKWFSTKSVQLRAGIRKLIVRYQKAGKTARLHLFWSAERFPLEPIPPRLLFHDQQKKPAGSALRDEESGRVQFEIHRCNRCHVRGNDLPSAPGPDLTHIVTNLSASELKAKLLDPQHHTPHAKMPSFGLTKKESDAVAAFLRSVSKPVKLPELPKKPRRRRRSKTKPVPEARAGEILFRSVGCFACHTKDKHGTTGPYAGGDLTQVSKKRSAKWIAQWLKDPKTLNADHRMPVFKLSNVERRRLALYLASIGRKPADRSGKRNVSDNRRNPEADATGSPDAARIAQGRKLVEQHRCAACHTIPTIKRPKPVAASFERFTPDDSCLAKTPDRKKHRPAYAGINVKAITAYLKSHAGKLSPISDFERGRRLLTQHNCTACHPRGLSRGIVETAGKMSQLDSALQGQSQGMIPPSLNAVGDKLLDDYLKTAVAGEQKTVRLPWLRVRMPRFGHSKGESAALVGYLKGHDRIPRGLANVTKPQAAAVPSESQILVAGQTLLGIRGFSCIACHKVGKYEPRNTALGTKGSDLMALAGRIRKPFFDRWTRNPIRIVPGMEMPSYHGKPVPGVLKDDVNLQLEVLWRALNDKRFKPPTNPSVVEQFITVKPGEPARIIRDVFTVPKENGGGYVARSLAIGLNNGHNLLIDLDTYSLRGWYFGDFARQRTEGKSWYWDMAGVPVMTGLKPGPDIILVKKDKKTGRETVYLPKRVFGAVGRMIAYTVFKFDRPKGDKWKFAQFKYVVRFQLEGKTRFLQLIDSIFPFESSNKSETGWERKVIVLPCDNHGEFDGSWSVDDYDLYLAIPPTKSAIGKTTIETVGDSKSVNRKRRVFRVRPSFEFLPIVRGDAGNESNGLHYLNIRFATNLKRERSKVSLKAKRVKLTPESLTTVPGYNGVRIPISRSIMPTALTWSRKGLLFTSLKGHIYLAQDADGDSVEDRLVTMAEGLAAPYGIELSANGTKIFVSQKADLLELNRPGLSASPVVDARRLAMQEKVLATGWGYTDNYHDWTCGIVRDKQGNLYVGLGSDYAQPKRPKDKARWRGKVLRISPKGKITPVGHSFRYPTGLAMNHAGDIFVSDNQGVQNTFNEINHLKEGAHYGVPSRYETNRKAKVTPPAIQVPHPWTRSVNGIFFLPETRRALGVSPMIDSKKRNAKTSKKITGLTPSARHFVKAFAGHGIGCEYDNRFLIRFSLQKVDGEYQGACYAFSKPNSGVGGKNFTGPLCGGVAPDGAIYIGSIYDSGWLGGRNTGDIVRLVPNGKLPNGIRELRVTKDGFEIEFIRAIDRAKANKPDAYSITGYNRIWKGSYSTPDSNRHTLKVTRIAISKDNKTVRLTVPKRRAGGGYLYEVSVGKIGAKSQPELFPTTGYYTLHRIPK